MGISVSHEEVLDGLTQEFGNLLVQKVNDAARFRVGMSAAEQQMTALEQEVERLQELNETLRYDLAQANAKKEEQAAMISKLQRELDEDDPTQES